MSDQSTIKDPPSRIAKAGRLGMQPRSPKSAGSPSPALWVLAIAILMGELFIDVVTPRGVSDWVFYMLPVLLLMRRASFAQLCLVAGAGTLFNVIGFVESPPGSPLWMSAYSRLLSLIVIWGPVWVAQEWKRAEKELQRVDRTLRVLSTCNHVLIHASSESDFLQEICRSLVDPGAYLFAWIGVASHDDAKSISALAQWGDGRSFLETAKFSWADTAQGKNPTGWAIRTGKTVVMEDLELDADFAPWRKDAHALGYASAVSLPLAVNGDAGGAMTIYSSERGGLNSQEISLLEELANDVEYGIRSLRMQSQKKEAEEALVKVKQAVEASGEVIFMTDTEGMITYVNPEFSRVYGYAAEDVVGKVTPRILKSGAMNAEAYTAFWGTILAGHVARLEMVNMAKDGRQVCVQASVNPILDNQGKISGFIAIQQDVSRRREAEDNLRLAEEKFRTAFNANPEPVTISTLADGRYIDVNESFLRVLGYNRDEVIGHTSLEIGYWDNPSDRDDFIHRLREHGEVRDAEIKFRTKAGVVRSALVSADKLELDGQECLLAVTKDITDRKDLERQFRQAQKMEAVGKLAGGIAHDFNNILTVINGYSDMLLQTFNPDDPKYNFLDEIRRAGERAATLTRQLLAFSRQQVLAPQILDLNLVIANMDKMLRRLIGEDVELVASPGRSLGLIKADPGQLEQIVMNLAVNARDAMPSGGKLTIETVNIDLDESYAATHLTAKPGPHVMLAVSDTGTGMDAETQRRIFEPFFSTKEPGKGTGLGLSTVYGIVKQSEGHIWVYSEPGQGTTLKVYFPRVDAPAEVPVRTSAASTVTRGTETILLVEDEPSLRLLVRKTLEAKGYTLLEATQGAEALAIAESHQGKIQLLLTDLVMPGISGRTLAEQMASLRPEIKVIFMSGYTDDAVVRHGGLREGMAFLQKPFTPDALARKVRDALDEGNQPT